MITKYFLTGATGFLGRTIIDKLLSNDVEIYAFVLTNDKQAEFLPANVKIIEGNISDSSDVDNFLKSADSKSCVIHCAGIISVATTPGKEIYNVNVEGTKNIIKACLKHNVGKLIYISSVHALKELPKGEIIRAESNDFNPKYVKGHYSKSKAIATNEVLKSIQKGLRACIVFPSGIIGPNDSARGNITEMILNFLNGKLPFAVHGGYDFVDVRDVADGILSCSKNGKIGSCYILSGHYASIKDILETVSKYSGVKNKVRYLPISLAKIVAPFYEGHSLRKKSKVFFSAYAVSVLCSNSNFSRKTSEIDLKFMPRPLDETLKDTVKWLKKFKKTET